MEEKAQAAKDALREQLRADEERARRTSERKLEQAVQARREAERRLDAAMKGKTPGDGRRGLPAEAEKEATFRGAASLCFGWYFAAVCSHALAPGGAPEHMRSASMPLKRVPCNFGCIHV